MAHPAVLCNAGKHDLEKRTPLHAIQDDAELFEESGLDYKQNKYSKVLNRST